jgi:hypothetical protein
VRLVLAVHALGPPVCAAADGAIEHANKGVFAHSLNLYNVQSLYGNSTFRPEICPPYHPVHLGGRGRGSRSRSIFFSFCPVFQPKMTDFILGFTSDPFTG